MRHILPARADGARPLLPLVLHSWPSPAASSASSWATSACPRRCSWRGSRGGGHRRQPPHLRGRGGHRRDRPHPRRAHHLAAVRVDGAAVGRRSRSLGGYLSRRAAAHRAAAASSPPSCSTAPSTSRAGRRPTRSADDGTRARRSTYRGRRRRRRVHRPARRRRRADPRLAADARAAASSSASARRRPRARTWPSASGSASPARSATCPPRPPDWTVAAPRRRRVDPGRAARARGSPGGCRRSSSCGPSPPCCSWRGSPPPSEARRVAWSAMADDLEQRDDRAPPAPRPLRHGQPARRRARGPGAPGRPAARRGLRGRRCSGAPRSARTSSRACAARADGPVLCLLSHVDTVLADAARVAARPVVGRRRRRRALGPRRAGHEVPDRRRGRRRARPRARGLAPRARRPARRRASSTRRPAASEGAIWLCENHPDARALRLRCSTRARAPSSPSATSASTASAWPRRASSASR